MSERVRRRGATQVSRSGLRPQPRFDLCLLLIPELGDLFLGGVVPGRDLVERVLGTPLELLLDLLLLLVEPQPVAAAIALHLGQSALLELRVRRLEPPLRVLLDLGVGR